MIKETKKAYKRRERHRLNGEQQKVVVILVKVDEM